MVRAKKPFFHSEELKLWEKRTIYTYLTITIALSLWYLTTDFGTRKGILLFYGVITQLGLYFALYTSLRNFNSYSIWCGFGFFHLLVYFIFKDDPSLQMPRAHASSLLRNTIVLLFLFQLLRYISVKLQHREFVAPAHGGGKDLFENKAVTFIDFVIFMIYIGAFAALVYLSLDQP